MPDRLGDSLANIPAGSSGDGAEDGGGGDDPAVGRPTDGEEPHWPERATFRVLAYASGQADDRSDTYRGHGDGGGGADLATTIGR